MITPQEIQEKEFDKAVRGYNAEQVARFSPFYNRFKIVFPYTSVACQRSVKIRCYQFHFIKSFLLIVYFTLLLSADCYQVYGTRHSLRTDYL